MKSLNRGCYVVLMSLGIILLAGCQSSHSNPSKDKGQVIVNKTDVKNPDVKLEKLDVSKADIDSYKKNHSGENPTRDYIIRKLLNELYPVSEKESQQLLSDFKESQKDWENYLKENNLDEKAINEQIVYDKQVKQLVVNSLTINDQILKDYYQANHASQTMEVQHILVNTEEEINKIYKDLQSGKDFGELAEKYSIDEETNKDKGIWKNYQPGTSLEVVDQHIEELKEAGNYSQPFHSVLGWHLVKLKGFKDVQPFDEVKDQIKNDYITSRMTSNYINDLLDAMLEENKSLLDKELQDAIK